jgi:hypothetical protein
VLLASIALAVAGCQAVASEKEAGWIALFDGKTLDGWEQHSG